MAFALSVSGGAFADTSQWTIVASSLDTGANAILSAVSCAGMTCWAVGGESDILAGQRSSAVLEGDTGNGWFMATDPSPNGGTLSAVACVDAGDCWAVGSAYVTDEPLIEQYANGAWSYVAGPVIPNVEEPALNGIACPSLTDCWAVGTHGGTNAVGWGDTLIEHYDGATWAVVSSPDSSPTSRDTLNSVACPAADDCWAVGADSTDSAFVEHYDGTAWTIDTDLADPGSNNYLNGVTCISTDACWAVGNQGNVTSQFTQTVIEQYDGTSWTRVSSPNPIGGQWGVNLLYGVSCNASGACWAVGQSEGVEGLYTPGQSLIAEYTGPGGWTAVTNPDPGLSGDEFRGVGCGADYCVAAGTNEGAPLLAQGPFAQLSQGGATSGSGPSPSSGTAGKTTADPAVPDTGGNGSPWAPLLLAGGVVIAVSAYRLRRRGQYSSPPPGF
jgi:hypothetical protein